MLNIFDSETKFGGWYVKGIYKLQNSTSNEMYSRLDKNVAITERSVYGKCAFFSIDGGKKGAYIPLSYHSAKQIKDLIQLNECYVVVMGKYGEDDIYRIIEKNSGVNCDDNSILHDDLFAHFQIYGLELKEISRRNFNSTELSHLNTNIPGIVIDNGKGGYSCKLFVKGSTTQFYCKSIAPDSDVHESDMFDIMKSEVCSYKRDDSSEIKIKVFIPAEAKDLSRIDSLKRQEETLLHRKLHRNQADTNLPISQLQQFANADNVEIETNNNEYQHLCSLIGKEKAEKYKPYVDTANEKANERAKIKIKRLEEEKLRLYKRIELYIACGYWIVIWLAAFLSKQTRTEMLGIFSFWGPCPLLVLYFLFIYFPFKYEIKSNLALRILIILWIVHITFTVTSNYL